MKTYNTPLKIAAAVVLTISVMGATAPAFAAINKTETVTTTIDARDMETARGIKRVYESLERKAEAACTTSGRKSISDQRMEKACKTELLEDFVNDIADARLSVYHVKACREQV